MSFNWTSAVLEVQNSDDFKLYHLVEKKLAVISLTLECSNSILHPHV